MAITCGRISRPLGASLSIGTTSTASSPGRHQVGDEPAAVEEVGRRQREQRLAQVRRRPSPVSGGERHDDGARRLEARAFGVGQRPLVDLVERRQSPGHAAAPARRAARPRSRPSAPASVTMMPRSTRSSTARVRAIRNSPSAPSSSMPAVSTNSTGPSGSSSIGFSTGSVVVPAVAETIDTCCRVMAFSSDDLPTLRRPNRPMWRRRERGVGCMTVRSTKRPEPGRA